MNVKAFIQSVVIVLMLGVIIFLLSFGIGMIFYKLPVYVVTIFLTCIIGFMVYCLYSHLTLSDQEEEKTKMLEKPWLINKGDTIYRANVKTDLHFSVDEWTYDGCYVDVDEFDFPTREECQLFCDTMNIAIAPALREWRLSHQNRKVRILTHD